MSNVIDQQGDTSASSFAEARKRRLIIALLIVFALLLVAGVGGVFYVRHVAEAQRQTALDSCEKALTKYNTAVSGFTQAVSGAAGASKITVEQVADSTTVGNLTQALAAELPNTTVCASDASTETLTATAGTLTTSTSKVGKQTTDVEQAAAKVTESKAEKELADAKTQLNSALASARTLLESSSGQVADENTRTTLTAAITTAQKVYDNQASSVKQLQDAAGTLSSPTQAVNNSITKKTTDDQAAAQAAAQAQQQYSPTYSSGGYNYGGNTNPGNNNSSDQLSVDAFGGIDYSKTMPCQVVGVCK